MVRNFPVVAVALLALAPDLTGHGAVAYASDALVAKHAAAYGVPESLVRRVIHIESKGNARVVSKGNYGLMQIRLGTARAMGYQGGAEGLLDADTNMTYAVKYLAGAYRAARGNHEQAIRNYQRGYYYQAKAQGFSPYTMASNVQQPVTQQAAAPDPALVQQELARQQASEQRQAAEQARAMERQAAQQARIAQQQVAQQARVEQQHAAQQARIAQRQAMLQERIDRQQAAEQRRAEQRQAALQQQVEREQARRQLALEREQAKRQQAIEREQARQQRRIEQQRAQSARPVAPRRAEAAPNYAWYSPMRYFKHPSHQAHPYKPVER
jgi:hypothetical protein